MCYCKSYPRAVNSYVHANLELFSGDYDKCCNLLISSQSLCFPKCAMKCINKHRNWAKLQLMPQSSWPIFPLQQLCWCCGRTPTALITKMNFAKNAISSALPFPQMQTRCVNIVSHLFSQMAANIFTQVCQWQTFAGINAASHLPYDSFSIAGLPLHNSCVWNRSHDCSLLSMSCMSCSELHRE